MNCKNVIPFRRKFSTKLLAIPDEKVLNDVRQEAYKPKNHPGVVYPKVVHLPDTFIKAVTKATQDYSIKNLKTSAVQFSQYLKARIPPLEEAALQTKISEIQQDVSEKYKMPVNNEEDEIIYKNTVRNKTFSILVKTAYNWKPLQYDQHLSLLYLLSRSAPEYAVLLKIMGEISLRDQEFKPSSLFDFGSGIGTASWAAIHYWKDTIFEYFNVDISREMNDLSEILLRGGSGTGKMAIRGVFYRQFLPASIQTYDLVVCAYTLLEMPSAKARLETILNLWNKTNKYLIVVEQGNNSGFQVINEIRDYILQLNKESSIGHVFSPCPQDNSCPRFLANDGTPCNFVVKYSTPFSNNNECKPELYSYVVLKKGKRTDIDLKWPRIVRPVLVRSKHTICRICTASGKLGETIFTAQNNGKMTYYCARKSQWGDLLPVTIKESTDESV